MAASTTQETLLYEWLSDCDRENILLCFKGDFNQDLVNAIVLLTEQEPDMQQKSAVLRSRVFSVLVEAMQNIRKYAVQASGAADLKPGIVVVSHKGEEQIVSTGNFVHESQMRDLEKRLSQLKGLTKDELRALHKKNLSETELTDKSGAGLGLISMARKANAFTYHFRPCANGLYFYSLNVHLAN